MQSIFNDRQEGGGRHQFQKVLREVLELALSGENPQLTTRLRKLLLSGRNGGGGVIGVSGAGSDHQTRSEFLILRIPNIETGEIIMESSGPTHHREDALMIYSALKRCVCKGWNAIIAAADGDLWKMGMIAVENALSYHQPVGVLALKMTEAVLAGGITESHFHCNEGVSAIANDPRFSKMSRHMRAIKYVAFSEALGGDVTHLIPGVSQTSGMDIILQHLNYIGTLVRLPYLDEIEMGLRVVINADAFLRLNMILYAARDSPVFMEKWPGSSVEMRQCIKRNRI